MRHACSLDQSNRIVATWSGARHPARSCGTGRLAPAARAGPLLRDAAPVPASGRQVMATRGVAAGEELLLCYAHFPSAHLFWRYGWAGTALAPESGACIFWTHVASVT